MGTKSSSSPRRKDRATTGTALFWLPSVQEPILHTHTHTRACHKVLCKQALGQGAGGCSVLHCSGGLLSASAESEQSFNKGGEKKKTKQEEELSFSLVPLQKP